MEKTEDIKNQYITLGNLAKLARIGRDTLSFYVKKQLIRPVFIGENGYKYFLPEQVQTVNFIRFFRKLDFSLESIATMLDHEKERPGSSELLFEYHKKRLSEKIEELQSAMLFLECKNDFLNYVNSHENDQPSIEILDEGTYYLTPVPFCHSLNDLSNAEKMSAFFFEKDSDEFQLPCYPICCIIPHHVLITDNFCSCMHNERLRQNDPANQSARSSSFTREAGQYACLVHKGGTETIFPTVRFLLDWLQEQNIEATGNAYVINSYNFLNVTENQSDAYIVQIRI